MLHRVFLTALTLAMAASPAAASCVHPTGLSGCFTTVQAAVDAASPGESISINAGTYVGLVVIDRSLMLVGVDRDLSILDGGAAGSVVTTAPGLDVTLQDLTIRNGSGTPSPDGPRGGGILGAGRLTLTNVAVRDNTVLCIPQCSHGGGGIFFGDPKGRLTIVRSSVRDNSSTYGGGIHVIGGRVQIVESTISGNEEGAISEANSNGRVRLEIIASTLSDNSGFAPALEVAGRTQITNSTISGNTRTPTGCTAGVELTSTRGSVTISSSTIADNTSTSSCGNSGAGVDVPFGKVSIVGSILAGNRDVAGERDCGGTLRSSGSNLVGDTMNCVLAGKPGADLVGVAPNLGPLQDNGGPTETRALLPGSPALDAATRCPKTDQRGEPRIRPCDIGAFEL